MASVRPKYYVSRPFNTLPAEVLRLRQQQIQRENKKLPPRQERKAHVCGRGDYLMLMLSLKFALPMVHNAVLYGFLVSKGKFFPGQVAVQELKFKNYHHPVSATPLGPRSGALPTRIHENWWMKAQKRMKAVVVFVSLEGSIGENSGHANVAIFDMDRKTVFCFDPWGVADFVLLETKRKAMDQSTLENLVRTHVAPWIQEAPEWQVLSVTTEFWQSRAVAIDFEALDFGGFCKYHCLRFACEYLDQVVFDGKDLDDFLEPLQVTEEARQEVETVAWTMKNAVKYIMTQLPEMAQFLICFAMKWLELDEQWIALVPESRREGMLEFFTECSEIIESKTPDFATLGASELDNIHKYVKFNPVDSRSVKQTTAWLERHAPLWDALIVFHEVRRGLLDDVTGTVQGESTATMIDRLVAFHECRFMTDRPSWLLLNEPQLSRHNEHIRGLIKGWFNTVIHTQIANERLPSLTDVIEKWRKSPESQDPQWNLKPMLDKNSQPFEQPGLQQEQRLVRDRQRVQLERREKEKQKRRKEEQQGRKQKEQRDVEERRFRERSQSMRVTRSRNSAAVPPVPIVAPPVAPVPNVAPRVVPPPNVPHVAPIRPRGQNVSGKCKSCTAMARSSGRKCSRKVSCRKNCARLCWQHAVGYTRANGCPAGQ